MLLEELSGGLLTKAVEKLLSWSFETDHPLNDCKPRVKELIQAASRLASRGQWDEAIDRLEKAAVEGPKYVGSRVRMMKYLTSADKPLHALLVGGSGLVLTGDDKTRSQIFDMASGVALDAFKKSGESHIPFLLEALAFINKATSLAPDNIVFAWNRLEIQLFLAKAERKRGNRETSDELLEAAKEATIDLIHTGREGGEYAARYWRRLVDDAQEVFPSGSWWRERLYEMDGITKRLEDAREFQAEDPEPSPPANWKRRSFLIASLAVLGLSGGYFGGSLFGGSAGTDPPPAPVQEAPLVPGVDPDSSGSKSSDSHRKTTGQSEQDLARLNQDDADLVRLDLDDDHIVRRSLRTAKDQVGDDASTPQRDLQRVQSLLIRTTRMVLDDDHLA